jgi:hypothetical protein
LIVFDLCCAAGDHRFEAWFASSDSFAEQQARGLINCPVCGDAAVTKAVMAPRVGAKSNQQQPAQAPAKPAAGDEPSPELVRRCWPILPPNRPKCCRSRAGSAAIFADAARAMHEGRAAEDLIHGQASPDEAQALRDDGIAAMPLLVPIVPPETAN